MSFELLRDRDYCGHDRVAWIRMLARYGLRIGAIERRRFGTGSPRFHVRIRL